MSHQLTHFISTYGYWGIAGMVTLESMGAPVPAETALVAAALYAARTAHLNIGLLFIAAAVGAIVGDSLGYWIGREVGYPLLVRYGRFVRLSEARIKLGRYLFVRYGGRIVFFGRFVSAVRTFVALIAGASRMTWSHFLAANAAGGMLWAAVYSIGPFIIGRRVVHLLSWGSAALILIVLVVGIAILFFLHRNANRLQAEALRAFPDPL
ncbi:MAG: hypothetical protein C5B46_08960 [Proteobacteria bacterium]|nr:MAG: hypothetical protein C5B46_08960 [Pseudomonadota bacterium]